MTGMFIIYAYFQIPMGTLLLLPPWTKRCVGEWKEAARLMNAGSTRFWLQVGIPVMMPGILGTFNMLFANAVAATRRRTCSSITALRCCPSKSWICL